MNLEQEYAQWLKNYEELLDQLKIALRFNNKQIAEDLQTRIVTTQVQIAMCARLLKQNHDANACGSL